MIVYVIAGAAFIAGNIAIILLVHRHEIFIHSQEPDA